MSRLRALVTGTMCLCVRELVSLLVIVVKKIPATACGELGDPEGLGIQIGQTQEAKEAF